MELISAFFSANETMNIFSALALIFESVKKSTFVAYFYLYVEKYDRYVIINRCTS